MNTLDTPTLDTFLNQIIREKAGTVELSTDATSQMKADLLPRLHTFILLKTMTELAQHSPVDLVSFQKLVDQEKPLTDIQAFVSAKIPDFPVFLADVFLQFRNIYLGKNF